MTAPKCMAHFWGTSAAVLSTSTAILVATGCASVDPWDVADRAPVVPSAVYSSSAAAAPALSNKPTAHRDRRTSPSSKKSGPLTLAECIRAALENNPKVRKSWESARAAAAGVGQAHSPYLPSADFMGGMNRGDSASLDGQQDTGASDTYTAGFSVRYLLFDGGARAAGLKGAEADLITADFQHNVTLQDVALSVEEAYYQVLAAKEIERVAEQTVRQTQYHVEVARARHGNGIAAKSDVLKAATEKAGADLELVRARSQVRITRGQLANAMGIRPSTSFEVVELPRSPHTREQADIERLMTEAAAHRPELRAALARTRSNQEKVKAAKARYWPKLTLDTEYGRRDRTFPPDRNEWSLGVGVTFPLFDGLNREYAIRRAKSELAGAVAAHEALLRGVELEVWIAYARQLEAGQAIDAAQALVASAEESARVAEGEYKNGTGSIIDLIDAQTKRTSALVQLVQARLDWYTAMARLERAIGRTLARNTQVASDGETRH